MSNGLKNVRVEYSNQVTVNMGNFENQRPGYKVSADVEDGIHPDEARAKLRSLVDRWLEDEIKEIRGG